MADTTEGDSIVLYQGLLTPALLALIAGLVIHSFIIGVNVTDWWKGRSVTPVDHIVTSLGISRLCAQCADTLYLMDRLFLNNMHSHIFLNIMSQISNFFTYLNIWLTSLLSIVLCLKISNLHTRLFLYLRRMILHRTGHLIAASLLLSALHCLIHLLTISEVSTGGTYNTTMDNISKDCTDINALYYYTTGTFFPLLFYYVSSTLLFISLYHHTTRMKMSNNLSINLETYYSVMKCVSFTFIYITIYFIGHFASAIYYYFYCSLLSSWLYIVVDFLPVLHSSYLIYKTAKLRTQMSKVLHNVIDFLFQRKDTETRENINMK